MPTAHGFVGTAGEKGRKGFSRVICWRSGKGTQPPQHCTTGTVVPWYIWTGTVACQCCSSGTERGFINPLPLYLHRDRRLVLLYAVSYVSCPSTP
jgi:hypothetical protein